MKTEAYQEIDSYILSIRPTLFLDLWDSMVKTLVVDFDTDAINFELQVIPFGVLI